MTPLYLSCLVMVSFAVGRWSKSWPREAPEGTESSCWEATLARRNGQ